MSSKGSDDVQKPRQITRLRKFICHGCGKKIKQWSISKRTLCIGCKKLRSEWRHFEVLTARLSGMTLAAMGRKFNLSHGRIQQMYRKASRTYAQYPYSSWRKHERWMFPKDIPDSEDPTNLEFFTKVCELCDRLREG